MLWLLDVYFFKDSLNINRNDSLEFLFELGSRGWRDGEGGMTRVGGRGVQLSKEVSFRAPNPTHSGCSYKETPKCHN